MKYLKIILFIIGVSSFGYAKEIKITILYDNTLNNPFLEADWGFACLVENMDHNVLFDTGTRPDILFNNADKLGIDLNDIDIIVLSHHHRDHIGGLDSVLSVNPGVEVYFPVSFPAEFKENITNKSAKPHPVTGPIDVCENIKLTGEMGDQIIEQSMVLKTEKGCLLVTGCSHPGIVDIIKKSKIISKENVYLIFGGFHLLHHTDEQLSGIITDMKNMGVEKCGATHCTGEHAIDTFRNEFDEHFVEMGVGKILNFTP